MASIIASASTLAFGTEDKSIYDWNFSSLAATRIMLLFISTTVSWTGNEDTNNEGVFRGLLASGTILVSLIITFSFAVKRSTVNHTTNSYVCSSVCN